MFRTLLEQELKSRKLSIREAARQIGISHAGLTQILQGRPFEMQTAQKICSWMGVDPVVLFESHPSSLFAVIAKLIAEVPYLEELFQEAALSLEKGEISKDDLREIAEFVAFKINRRKLMAHQDQLELFLERSQTQKSKKPSTKARRSGLNISDIDKDKNPRQEQ